MIQIEADVRRIVYSSPDGRFAILDTEPRPGERVRIVQRGGPRVMPGDRVRISGTWSSDGPHGPRIEAHSLDVGPAETPPATATTLLDLGVAGIGPKRATRLAEAFGPRLWDLLLAGDPDGTIRPIAGRATDALIAAVRSRTTETAIRRALAALDLPAALRTRILAHRDPETPLHHNPWRLCRPPASIPLSIADGIAQRLGLPVDHPARVEAAILQSLTEAERAGHSGLPPARLTTEASRHLATGTGLRVLPAAQDALLAQGLITRAPCGLLETATTARAEATLAKAIHHLLTRQLPPPWTPAAALSTARRQAEAMNLTPEQEQALCTAFLSPLSILTGPPGTGKTRTIAAMLAAFRRLCPEGRALLVAPTGIAAERAGRTAGVRASTIHRALGWNPETGQFAAGPAQPLNAQLLIADEASMIGLELAAALFSAVGEAHVVLVGDPDQLPPVEPGQTLADLLAHPNIPTTQLNRIFRQNEGSAIALAADAIRRGRLPPLQPTAAASGLVHLPAETPEAAAQTLKTLLRDMPDAGDPERLLILTPGHQSPSGTLALNALLQTQLNPRGAPIRPAARIQGGQIPRIGDPLLNTQNRPDRGLANGHIGRLIDSSPRRADNPPSLRVRYPHRTVDHPPEEWASLTLAYALTVHKAQGAEAEDVILLLTHAHRPLLKRSLLYTAVSRARRRCFLIGPASALHTALETADGGQRYSGLPGRLRAAHG